MIHIADTKVTKTYGDYFVNYINKFESNVIHMLDEAGREPLAGVEKAGGSASGRGAITSSGSSSGSSNNSGGGGGGGGGSGNSKPRRYNPN